MGAKAGKANKRQNKSYMSLFFNATIVMSLLSWYTTYGGFKNTVFAEGQELTAGLASLAIQLILLGGVINYVPVIKIIWQNGNNKNISILAILFVTCTFSLSMIASIMFSYISIANTIYKMDFEVNANIKLDEFMRNTIQEMEMDNQKYQDSMRELLIKQMKESGEKIIMESAFKRAKEYAATTAILLEMVESEELVYLDNSIDKIYKKVLLKKGDKGMYWYKYIRKDYVDRLHRNFIISRDLGDSRFSEGLKNKINNLNRDKYAVYAEYHSQYAFAVDCYNRWISGLKSSKNSNSLPTLEEMESLYDFCITIQDGLRNLQKSIDEVADGSAETNTKRLISEAKMNMNSLILETDDLTEKVKLLIKNSYGQDSRSFEELISAFGSSETSLDELTNARRQLLEMQGAFLQEKDEEVRNITLLMNVIERYIYAVEYSKNLDSLKTKVYTNYNIVKSVGEDGDKNTGLSDVNTDSATGGEGVATDIGIEENSWLNVVIDVTPDGWKEIKKSQMTELEGLIYGHPLNIYPDEEDDSTNEKKSDEAKKNKYTTDEGATNEGDNKYISQAELYRKSFLDTSDMEKAYNLLLGKKRLFEYKGKAVLALIFAVFLDFGAFLIGLVMYISRTRRGRKGN